MIGRNAEIFSRVSPTSRGNDRLLIFGSDQAKLTEDQQRPFATVESDGETFNLVWTSNTETDRVPVKMALIWKRQITSQTRGNGLETTIDGVYIAYDGDQSRHPWTPRFGCVAENLLSPENLIPRLSQLIAETSVVMALPPDRIEQMIRGFITPTVPVT